MSKAVIHRSYLPKSPEYTIEVYKGRAPMPKTLEAFFSFSIVFKGTILMTTPIQGVNITNAQTEAFALAGNVYAGDTFVEPTVIVTPTNAGAVALQPSFTAPTDGSSPVSPVPAGYVGAFTTAGVFAPATGYVGPVTLSAEVLGVDDQDATFQVTAPPPTPETATFNPTGFVAQN